MAKDLDRILDECVDRINRGEKPEDCLASYPEYAAELEPLLRVMLDTQMAYTFAPSPVIKTAARQRFNAALDELMRERQGRQPLFPRVLGWSKAWAAVTAVLVLAIVGYFGLRQMTIPIEPVPQPGPLPEVPGPQPTPPPVEPMPQPSPLPVQPVPQPSPTPVVPGPQPSLESNFVFLISDEVNAIGDFHSLNVTVASIGLQQAGESDEWIELDPQVNILDLTRLQGDKAREIWSGHISEGQYTKVFIHVSNISGVLMETGESVDVKLPSEKLQISTPFEVTSDSVVNFVYDITVVEGGKSGKYILKPQAGQSGADQKFEKIDGKK